MSEPLRAYEPTEKGRELIALLFPLPHHEREKNIQEYWKQYPQEKAALLDGFQFMLQEIAESRSGGGTNDCLNLPKPLVEVIIKQMVTSENFLAYDSGHDFLQGLAQYTPPLLGNIKDIKEALQRFSKPEPAEYSAAAEEKIKQVCKVAEDAYDQIAKILHSIRNSQKVIDMYQDVNSGISLIDVKLAKETFLESKKIFLESGKKIAAGMEYIYGGYQQFPDQLQIKKAYIKYLAKLLASREARNPPENYILKLAEGPFDFSLPDFEPTDKQLQYGKTKYSIKKEYSNLLQQDVNRLEARYRKRKLTTMLKQKALKSTIIKELQAIIQIDPADIRTHIFLAKLYAEYSASFSNHIKRSALRNQALKHCELAFGRIDDYLDLQAIEKMAERDQIRASFVKTISNIRIPLIRKK